MSRIQTGILIGGASDGRTMPLRQPDIPELIVDRPRKLTIAVKVAREMVTMERRPSDTYVLENLRCHQDGVEFLFYRHSSLTAAEAFAMLFKHYGEKAR